MLLLSTSAGSQHNYIMLSSIKNSAALNLCVCVRVCVCVCVCVCININILTWDSIGYIDLLIVSLARMRGNYSFGLALNQSVIIVFVAMMVAADARYFFQGAT